MRRLNAKFSQIDECISMSLFAVEGLPRNPELYPGELLLLQLVREDAKRLGKLNSRIDFALIFNHAEEDKDGSASRAHWLNAGKAWRYILHCRDTVPALPFSLEKLSLTKDYSGQAQCVLIEPADEEVIRTHFRPSAEMLAKLKPESAPLLFAIRNQDKIIQLLPERTIDVVAHNRTVSYSWLAGALKELYRHKCQVCAHDFLPRYSIPFADTHYLKKPEKAADRISQNIVVVCPNHDAIIRAAKPTFNRASLEFRFPNGLIEPLQLRDHLMELMVSLGTAGLLSNPHCAELISRIHSYDRSRSQPSPRHSSNP